MTREEDLAKAIELQAKLQVLMDDYSIGGAMVSTGILSKPLCLHGIPPPQHMMDSYLEMEKLIQTLKLDIEKN